MGKSRLDIEYDYDFLLFGISCHVKDYRLCWAINNALGLQLRKEADMEMPLGSSDNTGHFSFYSSDQQTDHLRYMVVSNHSSNGRLIQEQRQSDYFLLVEGVTELVDRPEVLRKLRGIDIVLTAFELDPNALKSKQNLLFE